MINKVYSIDDWCEDYGNVLLLHFPTFDEPPESLVSSPNCSDFEENPIGYWSHFIILDLNSVIEQAIAINKKQSHGVKLFDTKPRWPRHEFK